MRRRLSGRGRLVVLTAVTALVVPASAEAGSYRYYSCKTPTGAAAPTDGWSSTANATSSSFNDSCAEGGPLRAVMSGGVAQPSNAIMTWSFAAPAGTSVSGFRIWRSVTVSYPVDGSLPNYLAAWPANTHADARETCSYAVNCSARGSHGDPMSGSNFISAAGLAGVSSLHFNVTCENATCPGRGEHLGDLRIHAAEVTLSDGSAPVAGDVGGPLTGTGPHRGTEALSFAATDSGGGVYRTVFEIDGVPVAAPVVDANNGRCADAGEDGFDPYEFKSRIPCRTSVSGASTSLDTTAVADGTHSLRVRLEDAAGNSRTVHGPATFVVDNVPPPALEPGGAPTVSGSAVVGSELRGTTGRWSGTGNTYDLRWQRCESDGSDCGTIASTGGERYTVTQQDLGRRLRLKVTATNSEGSGEAFSEPTAIVGQAPHTESRTPAPAGGGGGSGANAQAPAGAPNGDGASTRARLSAYSGRARRTTVRARYGRPVVVEGRLLDPQERPIRGASLTVSSQRLATGAGVDEHGSIRTDSDGAFRYTVAAGPSRTVRIGYRANTADAEFTDTTEVTILVQAGVALRATPRKLRNGNVATFKGRAAEPLPVRGVLVDLQARVGRSWRTFAVVRTTAGGAYRYRHRFRQTFVRTRFRFRARVRRDSAYPYLTGISRTASLVVRP